MLTMVCGGVLSDFADLKAIGEYLEGNQSTKGKWAFGVWRKLKDTEDMQCLILFRFPLHNDSRELGVMGHITRKIGEGW